MSQSFSFDVFLSHNAKDKPRVRRLAERLKQAGLRVWFDEWNVRSGDIITLKVDEGLDQSRVLLLCMSPNALSSGWVALERSTAIHCDPANVGRRFIPLLLADCKLPDTLRRYKYVDLRGEEHAGFEELLSACRTETELGEQLTLDPNSTERGRPINNSFLLFKASPLFTENRKARIVGDIARFREYLTKLGLYLPVGLLPIGVNDPNTAFGTNIVVGSQDVTLSDFVFLSPESIDDPTSATCVYGGYVIMKTLLGPVSCTLPDWAISGPSPENLARTHMSDIFGCYLNCGFWGTKTDAELGRQPWLDALWEIRERFGAAFADPLVGYLIKSFASNASPRSIGNKPFFRAGEPISIPNPLVDAVVHSHLFQANRIVDNNDSRLATMNEILGKCGITVPR